MLPRSPRPFRALRGSSREGRFGTARQFGALARVAGVPLTPVARPRPGRSCAAPILASKGMSGAGGAARASACGIAGSRAGNRRTGDPQGLRCLAQMPVDGLGAWHAAGHGADQQRRAHGLASSEAHKSICVRSNSGNAQCSNGCTLSRRRPWPVPFADPARCPDGRPCAASRAFRPADASLPWQRRCGSGWSRSGSTARVWPSWPRSTVPTARESVLLPSPGAACAYGRQARR